MVPDRIDALTAGLESGSGDAGREEAEVGRLKRTTVMMQYPVGTGLSVTTAAFCKSRKQPSAR